MKTRSVEIISCQRGWSVQWHFRLLTASQFTDEERLVERGGKYWWSALFNTWLAVKSAVRAGRATPSERAASGWT